LRRSLVLIVLLTAFVSFAVEGQSTPPPASPSPAASPSAPNASETKENGKKEACLPECAPPVALWITWGVMTLVLGGGFFALVFGLLRSEGWSLGEALSEEAGGAKPETAGAKAPMVASSSRLIALFGLLAILTVIIGLGYYLIWSLFVSPGKVPDLTGVSRFLYAMALIFAPYLANQIREAFSSLTAKTQ
jgi:hypothetical protein